MVRGMAFLVWVAASTVLFGQSDEFEQIRREKELVRKAKFEEFRAKRLQRSGRSKRQGKVDFFDLTAVVVTPEHAESLELLDYQKTEIESIRQAAALEHQKRIREAIGIVDQAERTEFWKKHFARQSEDIQKIKAILLPHQIQSANAIILKKRWKQYGIRALLESPDVIALDITEEERTEILRDEDLNMKEFSNEKARLAKEYLAKIVELENTYRERQLKAFPEKTRAEIKKLLEK